MTLINYANLTDINLVGVFYNKPYEEIKKIIQKTNLKYVQLHGNESDIYIQNLKNDFNVKVIKSLGLREKKDLIRIKDFKNADFLLFDYKPHKGELPGGNAKEFDWSILKGLEIDKPWFISGGINVNNIKKIQNNLIPYGIDISSGVEEKPGIKSVKKIQELIKKFNND